MFLSSIYLKVLENKKSVIIMINQAVIFILLVIFSLSLFVSGVSAVETPSFPVCANPTGTIKANYQSGEHGIAGRTQNYSGSDTVYQVTDNTLLQCFCPESKNGIQTNWLKASGYTEDDIQVLKNQGWVYIPNGSLWGLDESAYLAKNIDYDCSTSTTSVAGSSSSNNPGNTSTSNVPAILGSTIPSGFAPTGSFKSIFITASLTVISLFLGLYLKKKVS